MYLAPINANRFFERVFQDTHIAQKFLEDVLNVQIDSIELLLRKNKMTDDGSYVEFDFRCKILGQYVIIEMQQFYKQDVIKRFYMYFCNNTSLQLEKIPELTVRLSEDTVYKTKNYHYVEPSVVIVWMVSDSLGFKDDIVPFSIFPETLHDFIRNDELWATKNLPNLLKQRQEVLKKLNNKTKGLDFLQKNRLIYAFQRNIVKNKEGKMTKYYRWFEFAEKTKNPNNIESDFDSFKNEPIFMDVIEKLKTTTLSEDDFQYIADYDEYERGVSVFTEKIHTEGLEDGWEQASEYYMPLLKQAEVDKSRLEQTIIEENQKAEQVIRAKQVLLIRKCLKRGESLDDIVELLEIDMPTLKFFLQQIKAEDSSITLLDTNGNS